jgi:putative transposase
MSNHFHQLLSTPATPIDEVMRELLSACTRIIHVRTGRSGHLFGRRYYWSLIKDPLYYAHALKYVYRNPVKAGLSERVEEYPFSTFPGLVGSVRLPVAIHAAPAGLDSLVPDSYDALEKWLNRAHRAEEAAAIHLALRRKEFKLPVNRNTRKVFNLPATDAPPSPKGSDTKWWL